jgi:putative ABC transport system substrate-binding protein
MPIPWSTVTSSCSRRRSTGFPRIFQRSASYVDRILKGANPAELPAQAPVKFEFAINLKTATALGLTAPLTVIALADEVIE